MSESLERLSQRERGADGGRWEDGAVAAGASLGRKRARGREDESFRSAVARRARDGTRFRGPARDAQTARTTSVGAHRRAPRWSPPPPVRILPSRPIREREGRKEKEGPAHDRPRYVTRADGGGGGRRGATAARISRTGDGSGGGGGDAPTRISRAGDGGSGGAAVRAPARALACFLFLRAPEQREFRSRPQRKRVPRRRAAVEHAHARTEGVPLAPTTTKTNKKTVSFLPPPTTPPARRDRTSRGEKAFDERAAKTKHLTSRDRHATTRGLATTTPEPPHPPSEAAAVCFARPGARPFRRAAARARRRRRPGATSTTRAVVSRRRDESSPGEAVH